MISYIEYFDFIIVCIFDDIREELEEEVEEGSILEIFILFES